MIPIDQEADYVPNRPLRWSLVLIVASIVLSIIVTIGLMRGHVEDVVRIETKPPVRIDSQPYELTTKAEMLRTAAEQRLNSYGWIDRANGTIHVPLDVALDHYLGAPP